MPLLADGAMGTELLARSGGAGLPCRLNLERPELVLRLHREYAAAGARLLVANTLGASPEEARAGVSLARAACHAERRAKHPHPEVGTRCSTRMVTNGALCVAGSLTAEPLPDATSIEALGDADLLLIETVTSLGALHKAVDATRRVCDLPLMCTLSFGPDGSLEGLRPAEVAPRLEAVELAGFGYGCGFGPRAARPVMVDLRAAAPEAVLIAKPNLGLPGDGGCYTVSPAQMAAWAAEMAALGVQIIGACCGSTPAHIRKMAQALID